MFPAPTCVFIWGNNCHKLRSRKTHGTLPGSVRAKIEKNLYERKEEKN